MSLRFAPTRGAATLISSSSRGPAGAAATVTAGVATSIAEGATPTVSNSGSSSAATFNFGIPRGVVVALGWNFSTTTTDSDPGAGNVRFNHATPASVTEIYFDNVDRDGTTQTAWLDSLDDGGNSVHRGVITIVPSATPSSKLVYDVTGSVVDGTGYRKVTVAHISGTTLPSDTSHVAFEFSRDGGQGIVGGSLGLTDNLGVRADGVGGATLQAGLYVNDDSGNLYPATNDVGALGTTSNKWADLFIADGGVVDFSSGDVTITHSTNTLTFGGASSGYKFDAGVLPNSSDGAALGSAALMFSDLFLASGGILNFNNGNMTVTHSAGDLSVAGGTFSLPNSGLRIADSNASHYLVIVAGSDLTANRNFTITTGDAARTLTISGDHTLVGGTSAVLAGNQTLTGGFKATAFAAGTKSSGTFTPDPLNGNLQTATNGGAHTLDPPGVDCSMVIQYTNNASAGAVTTSGFTKKTGDTISTTDGNDFLFYIAQIGSFSHLHVQALQ